MDRMEARQDSIETEVRTLAATVARVETNQIHSTELNRLRFDALDSGLRAVSGQLADFLKRFEGILSGEVDTAQSRAGRELVEDYREWRASVDAALDSHDTFVTQGKLLARVGVLLVSTNIVAVVVAIAAAVNAFNK